MIGLVCLRLLPMPTIWFSLDEWNASDYNSDSDSIASEKNSNFSAFFQIPFTDFQTIMLTLFFPLTTVCEVVFEVTVMKR